MSLSDIRPEKLASPDTLSPGEKLARDAITVRDHFAGLAMQALIAATHATADDTPTLAYEIADAMLKARTA